MPGPIPGQGVLANIFKNAYALVVEPVFRGENASDSVVLDMMREQWRPGRTDRSHQADESVGSFVSRRLSTLSADNIVSAMLHGIYAGDIYQLSARSLMPHLYALELNEDGVVYGLMQANSEGSVLSERDYQLALEFLDYQPPRAGETGLRAAMFKRDLLPRIRGTSAYTFKGGMIRLVEAFERYLRESKNVRIEMGVDILDIAQSDQTKDMKVRDIFGPLPFQRPTLILP